MKYNEIIKVLEINGKESPVFMPNELFEDLQGYLGDSSHMAYAYSFMFLSHFLYRNCKYFNVKALLDNNMLKEILGYSKSNRTMNYITKKGGLLNEISYTEATKNYPVNWTYADEELTFLTVDDMNEYMDGMENLLPSVPKMFFLNYPTLAMTSERIIKLTSYNNKKEKVTEEVEVQGSFFDVEQTTSISFDIFMFCMGKEKLGVIAFYLYSWLKHKNDIHEGRYDVSISKLAEETGIGRKTILKYMDLLKGYRMVSFQHNMNFFVVGAYEEDRKATSYFTSERDFFSDEYMEYEKMGVQLRDDYIEMKAWEENARRDEEGNANRKANMPHSDLPF